MTRPGTTLCTGTFYPHSKGPADLDELAAFIGDSRTIHMREVSAGDVDPEAVVIRHDIDHSAVHALRFARWEAEQGIHATYFVLPTAPYFKREPTKGIALEIQALGHEVGVHNDAHTQSGRLGFKTPPGMTTDGMAITLLAQWAREMREWGIDVHGCADHGGGEPLNVDLWREPLNHDPLEAGLEYEAYLLHQKGANYISDNRGVWRAPLERVEGRQTHILCHPIHWELP